MTQTDSAHVAANHQLRCSQLKVIDFCLLPVGTDFAHKYSFIVTRSNSSSHNPDCKRRVGAQDSGFALLHIIDYFFGLKCCLQLYSRT
jgi:hypothetical protein